MLAQGGHIGFFGQIAHNNGACDMHGLGFRGRRVKDGVFGLMT